MAVDAEEAGMDAFMNKPFKLEELSAVYVKLLARDQKNQYDLTTCETASTPGIDKETLTLWSASHMDGGALEEKERLPNVAVAVLESEKIVKVEASQVEGNGSGDGTINGTKHNIAKVYAANWLVEAFICIWSWWSIPLQNHFPYWSRFLY